MSGGNVGLTLQSQSRIVDVGEGIFALRYVASTAKADAPRVVVEPFKEVGLSLISAPGGADRVLDGPGSCLLIRSERPARFTLTVSGRTPTSSLDAALQLEHVVVPTRIEAKPIAEPQIEILAHVARRGDALFAMGAWIGGPEMPSRIEGLTIRWSDRPADVDLHCTVVSKGRRLRRYADRSTGEFAGTRGEAAPIVGFELALAGSGADRFALSGEAQFLGSHVVADSGARLRFASPTGREALVGLKLSIAAVRRPSVSDDRTPSRTIAPPLIGRVRMFRGTATPTL